MKNTNRWHVLTVDWLPVLARLIFAATLLRFFWRSALTKLGEGEALSQLWTPSLDAWVQILPWRMEAVGYDPAALGLLDRLIVLAGTWAEFLLPALIVFGLFTRLAAFGMLGFIVVMSLVDVFGHGVAPGAWFNPAADDVIADQRAFWGYLLLSLSLLGGGRLSLDRLLFSSAGYSVQRQDRS